MNKRRIKICGVRDVSIAQAAARAGADYVGLVFAPGSPRQASAAQARGIVAALPAKVEAVGLFVDAPVEQVRETCRETGIKTVQLHGHETPHYAASLVPLAVIKSVAFEGHDLDAALAPWRQVRENIVAVLIDAPPRHHVAEPALPGGHGQPFDWEALARFRAAGGLKDLPAIFVAGGLTPDNVAQAIALLSPDGVDVSSGVESSRGVKDARLIERFCEAVRAADQRNCAVTSRAGTGGRKDL